MRREVRVVGEEEVVAVGGERFTVSSAMTPLPVGRFSMTSCWPHAFCRRSPTMRMTASGPLPGG